MAKPKKQNVEAQEPTSEKRERIALTAEQKNKQTEAARKIGIFTTQIKELLPEFEGKSAHQAFENSVINLEKKVEQYSKSVGGVFLSDEEKAMLTEVRNGRAKFVTIEE